MFHSAKTPYYAFVALYAFALSVGKISSYFAEPKKDAQPKMEQPAIINQYVKNAHQRQNG